MRTPCSRLFLLVLAALALASCASPGGAGSPASRPWAPADLRLLDPLDDCPASQDILALYTRALGGDLEIRLDLLDLPLFPDYDLLLVLQTPVEVIRVHIPAGGRVRVETSGAGLEARVVRDPWLDTVIVRFNRLLVAQPFTLQAASFPPGASGPADETPPVRSDALPPQERAAAVLAFWDAFPAATPAQALRRWDGAHTGPQGGRHGLKHILQAAEEYGIPVALPDLATPASLAALDLIPGAMAQVRRLASRGLALLPESAWSMPSEQALEFSQAALAAFHLPGSRFAWSAGGEFLEGYAAQFLPLADASHLARRGSTRLVPLASGSDPQATEQGPTLAVRRALVQAALSPDPTDLVALGGSLPAAAWGAFDSAYPTFAWLAAHPWVQVLDAQALLTFPVGGEGDLPVPSPLLPDPWLEPLQGLPESSLASLAWQAYLLVKVPTADPLRKALQEAYSGQVGVLLAAAAWAQAPARQADCDLDPDRDGAAECFLADERWFAVIETSGGRLTHLFHHDGQAARQVVGPGYQFALGLSDPSQWQPGLGEAADPAALPGAFSDQPGTFDPCLPTLSGLLLTLQCPGRVKTFQLIESGLEVHYQAADPITLRVSLAVDPPAFYAGDSNYQAVLFPGKWTWGPAGGIRAVVRTEGDLTAQGFTVSGLFLARPEDPDRDFPEGHYQPYPLSVVTIRGQGGFTTWIGVE